MEQDTRTGSIKVLRPSQDISEIVFVVLYSCTINRHIWIRVDKLSSKREAIGSYKDNPNSYVAAELPKGDMSFMVGDNRTYGGYANPALQKRATYEISQGLVSKSDDVVRLICRNVSGFVS